MLALDLFCIRRSFENFVATLPCLPFLCYFFFLLFGQISLLGRITHLLVFSCAIQFNELFFSNPLERGKIETRPAT